MSNRVQLADNAFEMSTNIRPAAIGDEALLAALNDFVQALHLGRRPDHFSPTQPTELATWYRSLLEKSTTRIWIAEEDDLPVGYLLAILHEAPENPFVRARRWCEIDQVAVDPSRRRRGIARAHSQRRVLGKDGRDPPNRSRILVVQRRRARDVSRAWLCPKDDPLRIEVTGMRSEFAQELPDRENRRDAPACKRYPNVNRPALLITDLRSELTAPGSQGAKTENIGHI
ncbi:MAG: GNAT family N-acetyltransferase [Acidobacteriota bacterium]